jgi:hypothetical protein
MCFRLLFYCSGVTFLHEEVSWTMPHAHAHAGSLLTRDEPNWYRMYYHAVLEGDRHKAKTKIDRAQQAIQDRLIELRSQAPCTAREPQDLCNALLYLGILLQHISTEAGGVLWD